MYCKLILKEWKDIGLPQTSLISPLDLDKRNYQTNMLCLLFLVASTSKVYRPRFYRCNYQRMREKSVSTTPRRTRLCLTLSYLLKSTEGIPWKQFKCHINIATVRTWVDYGSFQVS